MAESIKALQPLPSLGRIDVRRWFAPLAIVAAAVLAAAMHDQFPSLASYPEAATLPVQDWLSRLFDWLADELSFGLFTFQDLMDWLVAGLAVPLAVSRALLVSGIPDLGVPPLPWWAVLAIAGLVGHYVGGVRKALFACACLAFLVLFGMWHTAMQTLALVLVTVPLTAAAGFTIGVLASRWPRFEWALAPVLNVMQATPHFAYLVPVVVLFGFGAVSGLIATAIFALPPMVRCTLLGLQRLPASAFEVARMSGCTSWQSLWKVEVPEARQTILVGVNQVVNMSLAMVVITSLIGVTGLGYELLNALERLRLGTALELGVGIVVLALLLDRLTQSYANKPYIHAEPHRQWAARHAHAVSSGAVLILGTLVAVIAPPLAYFPEALELTVAPGIDVIVRWITDQLFHQLRAFNFFMLSYLLIPLRDTLENIPWVVVVAAVALAGQIVGGARLALTVGALAMMPAVVGMWEPAMRTLYMIGSAVFVCLVIGLPIGILAAGNERIGRAVTNVCDTLQTFPSFIYLIPVVMLFRVGDLAAITAVVIYAVVPVVRYTNLGLRRVPAGTIEAARMSGCTRLQLLRKVRLPLAMPEILLGVNQTVMLGLFMLAIASLIGTTDLGQEINKALSAGDVGRALTAGLCIAIIGIVCDLLLRSWSDRRKRQLGFA
ncbi:MAG: ABC transporter permease subunit [Halofilum sp. (in: g-proteobacteria)]